MKYIILTTALAGSFLSGIAQTYFYVDQILVQPSDPSEEDVISIDLVGGLSSTGAYVVGASASVEANTVTISISAADNGGLTVIVPHTETVPVGMLEGGSYTIVIDGQSVGDFAPVPQHMFTVSGIGSPCDALTIPSIQWHAFDDTTIMVHVTNDSGEIFSYPNFILFNGSGDTLALETVDLFGIGTESWHSLPVMNGVVIPTGPFSGSLELWTGFTDSLACSWDVDVDLCPPTACSPLILDLVNLGDGIAIGTYSWTIYDEDLIEMLNGNLELTGEIQWNADTVCLEPGIYSLSVIPDQEPTGGQVYHGLSTPGNISGPSAQVVWGLPALIEFPFYIHCESTGNSLNEVIASQDALMIRDLYSMWEISWHHGRPVTVEVLDALGRKVRSPVLSSSPIRIEKSGLVPGTYLLRVGTEVVRVVKS